MGKVTNSNVITKDDMIAIVANKTSIDKGDVEKVLNCLFNTIIAELSNNRTVRFIHFGTFVNTKYKSRQLQSPLTGDSVEIKERIYPKFKPAKEVKDRVNDKVSSKMKK